MQYNVKITLHHPAENGKKEFFFVLEKAGFAELKNQVWVRGFAAPIGDKKYEIISPYNIKSVTGIEI